ncbi:MAG: HD domain-containing protein [Gammaproteobacteria bacterium]|nr:HD domain-containing protein [Gammaproteobacteria bacterium]
MRQNRLAKALEIAHEAHRAQKRKGKEISYISRPMAVASLALDYGGGGDQAIAGLLHDSAA